MYRRQSVLDEYRHVGEWLSGWDPYHQSLVVWDEKRVSTFLLAVLISITEKAFGKEMLDRLRVGTGGVPNVICAKEYWEKMLVPQNSIEISQENSSFLRAEIFPKAPISVGPDLF
jgi:hypothetical protein